MMDMKAVEATLLPLPSKHYETQVEVLVKDDNGGHWNFIVSVSGYGPRPSKRALDRGWEPDWGMDHVESDIHLYLADKIAAALMET
jgi:hypothetical protein